jgi:hypothetical protein
MNIPDSCTLPTAERPLRLAEFDELFATAVRRVEPVTATRARLYLVGPPELEDRVRDLTARESECCSFFTFTLVPTHDAFVLDVEVPGSYTDVLAAPVEQALHNTDAPPGA